MMPTNLFVIANVKQLRTGGSLEFYCLFFRTSWSVGVLNSAIFNSFHNQVEFGTILEGLRNFGVRHWISEYSLLLLNRLTTQRHLSKPLHAIGL